MNKESFVFYESVAKQGDRLADKLGKEVAFDFYKAVIDFGLYGVLPDEDSNVWLYGFEQTITSSPSWMSRSLKLIHKASKPLASPTQYLVPMYLAHSSSKSDTSFPRMYQPERSTSIALSSYSFAWREYCLPKLFGIIFILVTLPLPNINRINV